MKIGALYRFKEQWFDTLHYGWLGSVTDETSTIASYYVDGKTATCLSPSSFITVPSSMTSGKSSGRKARQVLAAKPGLATFTINCSSMMFVRALPAEEEVFGVSLDEASGKPKNRKKVSPSALLVDAQQTSKKNKKADKKTDRRTDKRTYSWFEFLITPEDGSGARLFSWIFIEVDFDEKSEKYLQPIGSEAEVFHKYFEPLLPE